MEPNNTNGHPGNGNHSPSQSSLSDKASELGNDVKKAAQTRAEEGTDTAKRSLSSTASHGAEALGHAADSLRDQGEERLAQATTSVASALSDYSRRIEKHTAEDLIQDAVSLARKNPTLFVLGGLGLGLALSRFFKASSESN